MTISFDLDDTLIAGNFKFETIPANWLRHLLGTERLRTGTPELFRTLKKQNNSICIYTTSYRSKFKIRLIFLLHGLTVDKIINQQTHIKTLKSNANRYSKYPPGFNIDWHVDDSQGVAIEGKKHDFKTVIINPDDKNWGNTIIEAIMAEQTGNH